MDETTQHRGSTSREDLRTVFQSLEKGIILVDARVMKRVIRLHKDLHNISFHVPHADEYLLSKNDLLKIAAQIDPNLHAAWEKIPTEMAVLLSEPVSDELNSFSISYFGLKFWASLAHAEMHKRCIQLVQTNQLSEAKLKESINKIGAVEFEEIREVLASESLVFDAKDNSEVFQEFLAYWIELSYFSPDLVKKFFPSIKNDILIDNLLKNLGLEPREILIASQPPHTPTLEQIFTSKLMKANQVTPSLEVYEFRYHHQKVIEALVFEFKEKQSKEQVEAYFGPIVTALIQRCIRQDRIVTSLDFKDLKNAVLWSKPPYKFEDLLVLDTIFSRHLIDLYRAATPSEITDIRKRGEDFLEEIRENQGLQESTQYTLKAFGSIYEEFQDRTIAHPRTIAFHDVKGMIGFVLYRWVLYFVSLFFSKSSFALNVCASRRIRILKQSILKAKLYDHYTNPARSLIYWRKTLSLIQKTHENCARIEQNPVQEKVQAEIQKQIRILAENFTQAHQIQEEAKKNKLLILLGYLLERIEATQDFSNERHLLFDLQLSYQKAIKQYFKLNFDGFFRSFFLGSLIQKLPFQQRINKIKYFRSALKRIQRLKVREKELQSFEKFIEDLIEQTNNELRTDFRQILQTAFQENQLFSHNSQEKVGFEKLKEEILDKIIAEGRFKFSYLRDIISRNDLKLSDLTLKQLLVSDQLLSLDKYFRKQLFGVYSGGEIYMRILQRLSSLLFGNPVGRILTKFLLLPYLSSYIILEGMDHTLGILISLLIGPFHFYSPHSCIGLAIFLLCAINFEWGKTVLKYMGKAMSSFFSLLFKGIKALFLTRIFSKVLTTLIIPGLLSASITFTLLFIYREFHQDPYVYLNFFSEVGVKKMMGYGIGGGILFFNALFYTFIGMALRDGVSQLVADTALRLKKTLLIGLFVIIMEAFKTAIFYLEYIVYSVENSTRFNEKEKKISILIKGFFGVIWFWITYTAIIYINVLVEPQINPIKHFPVVTVSHKVILPLLPQLTNAMLYSNLERIDPKKNILEELNQHQVPEAVKKTLKEYLEEDYKDPVLKTTKPGEKWQLLIGSEAYSIILEKTKTVSSLSIYRFRGIPYIPDYIIITFVGLTVFLIPGLFGFMVWEFKENWKLYHKNRAKMVRPVLVGSHGEKLPQLLRKGFHSGTIPKLLKKIRQTGLLAHRTGNWSKLRKFHHDLHHVEEYLELFAERELLQNMKIHSRFMESLESIHIHEIYLTNNKIEIHLRFQKKEGTRFDLFIYFEDVFSWILGSCSFNQKDYQNFWKEQERVLLDSFLAVFFKKAGVELVREQIEDLLLNKIKSLKKLIPELKEDMKISYEIDDTKAVLNIFHESENKLLGKIEYSLFQKSVLPILIREQVELTLLQSEQLLQEQLVFKFLPIEWKQMNELFAQYEKGEAIKFDTLRITRINQTRFEGIH
ncbi:MAG: hypothetical protein AABZ60_11940 [Planctomycetota bacterium]